MITFILMEPEVSGNVGAVARVMKNFGFTRLVIIDPKCDVKAGDALYRSKHADDVLKGALIAKRSILKSFHTLIGTTAKLGTDFNVPRSPVTPDQLSRMLPAGAMAGRSGPSVGVLFGREGNGLTNDEILACDFTLTIPSQKRYPTMNLSHAVAVVAYELSKHRRSPKVHSHIIAASSREKGQLLALFEGSLDLLDFGLPEKKETQRRVWKHVFARSFLSKREAFALMGYFRHVLKGLKK